MNLVKFNPERSEGSHKGNSYTMRLNIFKKIERYIPFIFFSAFLLQFTSYLNKIFMEK